MKGGTAVPPEASAMVLPRSWRCYLWVAVSVFVVGLSSFCVLRHYNLWSDIFDMGVEAQVVWNTAQGRWFESSVETQNYLGDHTTFITLAVAAIYWLLPRVETLLVLQVVAFAAAAWPAYHISLHLFGRPRWAALFALAWLAQPAAGHALAYEYHTLAFAPLFSLGAYALALKARWVGAGLCLALLLLTREDCGITAVGLGLILATEGRQRRVGMIAVALGFAAFLLNLFVLLPLFRGEPSDTIAARYGHFGQTGSQVVSTLLTQPWLVVQLFVEDTRRLTYLPTLAAPFLLLAACSPVGALAVLFVAGPSLLSSSPLQYTVGWHYPLTILPVVFVASVYGAGRLAAWCSLDDASLRITAAWCSVLVVLSLQSVVVTHRWMVPTNPTRHDLLALATLIPADAPLSATSKLGAQFSHRRQLAIYPQIVWEADAFPKLPHRQATHILIDLTQPRLSNADQVPDPTQYELKAAAGTLRLYVLIDAISGHPVATVDAQK